MAEKEKTKEEKMVDILWEGAGELAKWVERENDSAAREAVDLVEILDSKSPENIEKRKVLKLRFENDKAQADAFRQAERHMRDCIQRARNVI